jgi:hypothetical protein
MSDVWTYKFSKHSELKDAILKEIESSEYGIIVPLTDTNHPGEKITKTDYYRGIGSDQIEVLKSRKYFWMFHNELLEFHNVFNKKYCVAKSTLSNFWFQQYLLNDTHDWHVHGNSNFSFVYFLELPDSNYSTQFFDLDSRKIFQLNVLEGDIIVFPSHIPHRSPPIKSNIRKTIISWNMSLDLVNTNLMNIVEQYSPVKM